MARKYKFYDNRKLYFITVTTVGWADVFIRPTYREIIYNSLQFCQQNKGLDVYAYCIMTSHLHLIIGTETGILSDIVRDFKSFTSNQIKKEMQQYVGESRKSWLLDLFYQSGHDNKRNKDWQFWQQHSHPIELNDYDRAKQRLDYIHDNPVKAGFVGQAEDWLHSSAADYAGIRKGYLDVKMIER